MNSERKEKEIQSQPVKSALEIAEEYYGGKIPEFQPSGVVGQAFPFSKIGYTADNKYVRDRPNSHFHEENKLSPETVKAAIQSINTRDRDIVSECIEFDRPIGLTYCVQTDSDDVIISAYRKGRTTPIPMVLGRDPEPCNNLCIVLRRINNSKHSRKRSGQTEYQLVTAYVGNYLVKTPDDPHIANEEERKRCLDFWSNHALIFDPNIVDWEKT